MKGNRSSRFIGETAPCPEGSGARSRDTRRLVTGHGHVASMPAQPLHCCPGGWCSVHTPQGSVSVGKSGGGMGRPPWRCDSTPMRQRRLIVQGFLASSTLRGLTGWCPQACLCGCWSPRKACPTSRSSTARSTSRRSTSSWPPWSPWSPTTSWCVAPGPWGQGQVETPGDESGAASLVKSAVRLHSRVPQRLSWGLRVVTGDVFAEAEVPERKTCPGVWCLPGVVPGGPCGSCGQRPLRPHRFCCRPAPITSTH